MPVGAEGEPWGVTEVVQFWRRVYDCEGPMAVGIMLGKMYAVWWALRN
jgi:hypothetical protein